MQGQRDVNGRIRRGDEQSGAKLTTDAVRAIRESRETEKVLAGRYGVSRTTIGRIRRRDAWAHIR